MLKLNIAVIAGYGREIDKLPMHRDFVIKSVKFGLNNRTDLFFVVGGDTDPDYPGETEAEASFRIIQKEFGQHQIIRISKASNNKFLDVIQLERKAKKDFSKLSTEEMSVELASGKIFKRIKFIITIVVLGTGNTSADTLIAVKDFLKQKNIGIDQLILCSETARSTGFDLDALMTGLKEMLVEDENPDAKFIFYGCSFPETKQEIQIQKKKLLGKLLSHYHPILEWLRQKRQKRHQYEMARRKKKQ